MEEELTADLPLWADEQANALLRELCDLHGVSADTLREALVIIPAKTQRRTW